MMVLDDLVKGLQDDAYLLEARGVSARQVSLFLKEVQAIRAPASPVVGKPDEVC